MTPRLLVIDDDGPSCRLVEATFRAEGLTVSAAHDGPSGLARVATDRPDVILLDVGLPGMDGLQVLESLKESAGQVPVVMLTASRDVRTAVRATQLGAFDYLNKPLDHDEVVLAVKRALETRALRLEVQELRRRVGHQESEGLIEQMGPSAQVRQVVDQVATVAASNFSVLILGETGTGKELVAQALHRLSDRRHRPFVALDCAAIPEPLLESELFGHEKGAFTGADRRRAGRFQLADGGTCFLDEIGNLPISLQAKLLRALESRQVQPVGADRSLQVDIRVIAATNDDLQERARTNQFRVDLYFRLAQYTISLPPLRQRSEDVPYLAARFLEEASVELRRPVQQLQPAAIELLQRHAWPGNVRELRNVVRQAVLRTRELTIRPADVRALLGDGPSAPRNPPPGSRPVSLRAIGEQAAQAAERQAICEVLRASRGNKSLAARTLQTDYKTLHVKIKRLGIRPKDYAD